MNWERVTVFCFFASYFLALVLEGTQFLRRSKTLRWGTLGFAMAGLVAHTMYLVVRSQKIDLPPLLGSTHDWLLVLAWLATVFYLGVQCWDTQLSLGLFALPLILVLTGTSQFVSMAPNPRVGSVYWWSMAHASMWVFGIGGMSLALVISLMYLVQHTRLKHRVRESPAVHLFSLERLSRLNWWLVICSVPLLTLGMVSGIWMTFISQDVQHPVTLANASFVVNAAIWGGMTFLFGWLLTAHRPAGRLVAWRTILACGFFLVSLLIMKIFADDGIHGSARPGIHAHTPEWRNPEGRRMPSRPIAMRAERRQAYRSVILRSDSPIRAGQIRNANLKTNPKFEFRASNFEVETRMLFRTNSWVDIPASSSLTLSSQHFLNS